MTNLDESKQALVSTLTQAAILILPFIICDIYYAYSYTDVCLALPIPSLLTLGTWLAVAGWYSLVSTIAVVTFGCGVIVRDASKFSPVSIGVAACAQSLSSLFSVAWTIIGSVIFWKYLQPNSLCTSSLSNYMWARLIISIVGLGSFMFLSAPAQLAAKYKAGLGGSRV